MTSSIRSLAAAVAAGMVVLFLVLRMGSGGSEPPRTTATGPAIPERGTTAVAPAEGPAARPASAVPARSVSYAVATTELSGLPLSAVPGARLDIWVAWEPPITKVPDIRRLLTDVTLDKIAPPVLPEGPHVALLLVKPEQVRDLLYGDRYGALSVTMKPE